MSFTDHKITQFAHRVADLPDEPQIPAAELKSRFDACPEELRQSLNAVCDDAARLEARVEGIVVDTFGDTIDKEMLSDELAAELDGKATQSALSAEAAARESADDALDTRLTALEAAVPLKSEVYIGTYQGNAQESQFINLGFTPRAVIVTTCGRFSASSISSSSTMGSSWYGGIATPDKPITDILEIEENGFRVYYKNYSVYLNQNSVGAYFAFR